MTAFSNNSNNTFIMHNTGEEIPAILRPEISDIFPIFASMLDIKSFMRLAMTSTAMYTRCMEDNSIHIKINEDKLIVTTWTDAPVFDLQSSQVERSHIHRYIRCLRRLRNNVTIKEVRFDCLFDDISINSRVAKIIHKYFKAIGVTNIERFECTGEPAVWKKLVSFIQEFHVKDVIIAEQIPEDILRDLLQINLSSFTNFSRVMPEAILNINSPIPEIKLPGMKSISKETFLQILWKIQTGSLKHLCVSAEAVDWSLYVSVPFEYEHHLPIDRPLLFFRIDDEKHEYWLLHGNGDVTKCEENGQSTEIFKCEPTNFPPALRTKEDVFTDLTEKKADVICSLSHFEEFFENRGYLTYVDGPFPEARPLLFKESNFCYWILDEGNALEEYEWNAGYCRMYRYDLKESFPEKCGHDALVQFIIRKTVQNRKVPGRILCNSFEQFRSWFECFETFPHDFCGPLPDERPLVFEKTYSHDNKVMELRVILHEDGTLFQCMAIGENRSIDHMLLQECSYWNKPSRFVTADDILYFVLKCPKHEEELIYRMDLEKFLTGLSTCKSLPFDYSGTLPPKEPVIFEKSENIDGELTEHRWFHYDGRVAKCTWRGGLAYFSEGDQRSYPPALTREIILQYLRGNLNITCHLSVFIDSLPSCLAEFECLPYDFSGTFPDDHPVIFVKTDEDESGRMRLWLLFCHQRQAYVTWDPKTGHLLICPPESHLYDIPRILTSKKCLQSIVETNMWFPSEIKWYGDHSVFVEFCNSFTRLIFDHTGPLPNERPLVFTEGEDTCWYMDEYDSVVMGYWIDDHALFTPSLSHIPDVLSHWYPPSYFDDSLL